MTSAGSTYGAVNNAFRRALDDGQLDRALAAAKELPQVGLRDAARLVYLMAQARDRRYPRAAVRWMARYVAEANDATPERISEVADALATMEHGADREAAEVLMAAAAVPGSGQ
jgi:signal recognition particle subunit SEC65